VLHHVENLDDVVAGRPRSIWDNNVAQGAGHSLPASVENIEASVQGRSGEEDAKLQREEDGVTVVATRDEEEDENDLSSCTICLEVLRPGQLATTLLCRHAFHQDCIMRWLGTKVYKQQAGCCPTCNFRVIAPAVLPPSADQPQTRSDPALRGAEHEPEPPGLALPPPISEPISSEIAPWARYTMLLAAGFAFFLFVTIAIVKAVMD